VNFELIKSFQNCQWQVLPDLHGLFFQSSIQLFAVLQKRLVEIQESLSTNGKKGTQIQRE
jgi:hypothetical protein